MTVSKQESAYQVIRERILSGQYSPGFRLVIDQLAKELGLSSIPVREAIRRMEAEGLVTYNRNAGAMVAPVDGRAYEEVLQVLAVLEGYATALTAPELTAIDIARLREINGEMEATIPAMDFLRFGQLNRAFHMAIYERCPNTFLVESIRRGMQRLDQVRHSVFGFIPGRATASVEEHAALITAIETGAPADQIEALARQHKLNTVRKFHSWAAERPYQPPHHE